MLNLYKFQLAIHTDLINIFMNSLRFRAGDFEAEDKCMNKAGNSYLHYYIIKVTKVSKGIILSMNVSIKRNMLKQKTPVQTSTRVDFP